MQFGNAFFKLLLSTIGLLLILGAVDSWDNIKRYEYPRRFTHYYGSKDSGLNHRSAGNKNAGLHHRSGGSNKKFIIPKESHPNKKHSNKLPPIAEQAKEQQPPQQPIYPAQEDDGSFQSENAISDTKDDGSMRK